MIRSAKGLGSLFFVACLSVFVITTFASNTQAQPIKRSTLATVELDGRQIILYNDGYWHYADAQQEICTDVPHVGQFCATPSDWTIYPVPQTDVNAFRPSFASGDDYWGQINSLTPVTGRPITSEDVEAFIRNRVFLTNGLRPSLILQDEFERDSREWQRFVFEGEGVVKAFSITSVGTRVIIAETHERSTTLFHREHRELHDTFLAGIKADPYE